ncbi:MAG: hypothetical protein KGK08_05120 [Acidobacteriota bacterium]|nr:hypothetical protein [Acidobacteriota bacterium]
MMRGLLVLLMTWVLPGVLFAEVCTTQSQMTAAQRSDLAGAAAQFAGMVQRDDVPALQSAAIPELTQSFAAVQTLVGETAAKLSGASLTVDEVFLLDGTSLKRAADGSAPDAQFFCTLNQTAAETDFLIPSLPPGTYSFALVTSSGHSPLRLALLLRQEQGRWLLAGLYPRPLLAAGHDGLWYWTTARTFAGQKQPWNAWLYYVQAEQLLRPANFVQSTHYDKLQAEQVAVAPPAITDGVTPETPLVVKAADGSEFHFTSLAVDDSLGKEKIDVLVHLKTDSVADRAAAQKRNVAAIRALVAAYPELKQAFHGVWVFADAAGQSPYPTELAMTDLP